MKKLLSVLMAFGIALVFATGCELDKKNEGVTDGTTDTGPGGTTLAQACAGFANAACSRQSQCGNTSDVSKCISDYDCGSASSKVLTSAQEANYKDCVASLPTADCTLMKSDINAAVPSCGEF